MKEMRRATNIKQTLGLKAAIGYLKRRGWSAEATVWILLYNHKQGA